MKRPRATSTIMPTCETPFPLVSKKTRSPSRSSSARTGLPVAYCWRETRGIPTDTSRYELMVSPEQSMPRWFRPPQTYGVPR